MYKSTDGGTTWTSLNATLTNFTTEILAVGPSTVYDGTNSGVYTYQQGGQSSTHSVYLPSVVNQAQ